MQVPSMAGAGISFEISTWTYYCSDEFMHRKRIFIAMIFTTWNVIYKWHWNALRREGGGGHSAIINQ